MEVDDAACLVFGHLDVPDCDQLAELLLGDAGQPGQVAGQVGGEPAPQRPGVQVEHHRGFVVVAGQAEGLAEPGIVLVMPDRAGDVPAVRAAPLCGVPAGRHGRMVLPRLRRACTGPNEGAVKVANTHGCAVTVSGMPLPPARPARTSWRASRL